MEGEQRAGVPGGRRHGFGTSARSRVVVRVVHVPRAARLGPRAALQPAWLGALPAAYIEGAWTAVESGLARGGREHAERSITQLATVRPYAMLCCYAMRCLPVVRDEEVPAPLRLVVAGQPTEERAAVHVVRHLPN